MLEDVQTFEELLKKHIKIKRPVAVEKMCGSTPKSAMEFYNAYEQGKYHLFNLTDLTDRYYERAKKIDPNIDEKKFEAYTEYHSGINVARLKLNQYVQKVDAVIYWSGALNCFQPFNKKQEADYKKMLEQENVKGKRLGLTRKQVELNVQKKFKNISLGVLDKEVEKMIQDDLTVLKKNGIIISNHLRDKKKIRNIIEAQGFEPTNYIIRAVPTRYHTYECFPTVWKKK